MAQQTLSETPVVLETIAKPAEGEALTPYQPLKPIGDQKTLKGLLERNLASLKQILPRHVSPERLMKTLLMAVSRQPDLLECTQESILEGVMRSAELGLDLSGTLGDAYLVPFNNKVKIGNREEWRKTATFIPGYRGLARLARQSGEVGRIEAEPVFEADKFVYKKGLVTQLEFTPAVTAPDRGKCLGYYALIMNREDTQPLVIEFMSKAQVEAVRKQAKSGNSPAWKNHYDEMGRKTAFRRAAKWAPLSGEKYQQAVALDNEDFDIDSFDVIETTAKELPAADEIIAAATSTEPNPAKDYIEAEIKKGAPVEEVDAQLLAFKVIAAGDTWVNIPADADLAVVKDALGSIGE